MKLSEKIFGTHSSRELKRIMPLVDKIEELRPTMQAMTDEELKDQTRKFKERLAEGETLDDLLPEAFATVREASKRVLNMEHYRVQLTVYILHQGRFAEMRTGEGEDFGFYLSGLSERAGRERRAYRNRQRLPGQTRCGVDG